MTDQSYGDPPPGSGAEFPVKPFLESEPHDPSAALLPPLSGEAEKLSPPNPDHDAHTLREIMCDKLDEACVMTCKEIDELIQQAEHIKGEIVRRTGLLKEAVEQNFNLHVEAMGFSDQVRRRLIELTNGG